MQQQAGESVLTKQQKTSTRISEIPIVVVRNSDNEKQKRPVRQKRKHERVMNSNNNNNVRCVSPIHDRPLRQPPISTTTPQHDIQKVLYALNRYAKGSKEYEDVPQLVSDQTPKLLLGYLQNHYETDLQSTVLILKALRHYATIGSRLVQQSYPDYRDRFKILREIFGNALRSGGTESMIRVLQKLVPAYWKKNPESHKSSDSTTIDVGTKANNYRDAICGCWGVVRTGMDIGIPKRSLAIVVQACLADIGDYITWDLTQTNQQNQRQQQQDEQEEEKKEGTDDKGDHQNRRFEILSINLRVLKEAISCHELSFVDLVTERDTLQSSCLLILTGMITTIQVAVRNNESSGITDEAYCEWILPLLEDLLGVLVVCAQRGLFVGNDFKKLVPICQASLSISVLLSHAEQPHQNRHSEEDDPLSISIPTRVMELIEVEDRVIGLWLREVLHLQSFPSNVDSTEASVPDDTINTHTVTDNTNDDDSFQQQEQEQQQQQRFETFSNDSMDFEGNRNNALPSYPIIWVKDPEETDDEEQEESEEEFEEE